MPKVIDLSVPRRDMPAVDATIARVTKQHATHDLTQILTEDRLCAEPARFIPDAKVLYCDLDDAHAAGFDIPKNRVVTDSVRTQLSQAYAVKTLRSSPGSGPLQQVGDCTIMADRYRDYISYGAGRAGTINGGYGKGFGETSLAGGRAAADNPGTCPLVEGIFESIIAKVCKNFFSQGATTGRCLIDVGDSYQGERQVLTVRGGNHVRPAHVTGSRFDWFPTKVDVAGLHHILGIPAEQIPAVLAYSHARTCAEKLPLHVMHGVEGDNNMGMLGQNIDFGYWSTQARTAPVHGIKPFWKTFGMMAAPTPTYLYRHENQNHHKVLQTLCPEAAKIFKEEAYPREKSVAWLRATGLKPDLAQTLVEAEPELVTRFRKLIMKAGKLFNDGPLNLSEEDVDRTSMLDVSNLLRYAPGLLRTGNLDAAAVEKLLDFAPGGSPASYSFEEAKLRNYQVAPEFGRQLQDAFVELFLEVYPSLVGKAKALGKQSGFFDTDAQFWDATTARAEFSNAPTPLLYRRNLRPQAEAAEAKYVATGDASGIATLINDTAADSYRNVDALMRQSAIAAQGTATYLQRQAIDGVHYEIRADADGSRRLQVKVDVDTLAVAPADIARLRLRLNGPKSAQGKDLVGRFDPKQRQVVFKCNVQPHEIMHLRGSLCVAGNTIKNCSGYVFAVPDAADIRTLRSEG